MFLLERAIFVASAVATAVARDALFAARANKRTVSMDEFDRAKDKIIMGAERRSMVMDDNEKKLTAYHEAGHAIVGLNVADHDPVYKVTIIPRGRALGVTMFLPEADRYSTSKRQLESRIATLFDSHDRMISDTKEHLREVLAHFDTWITRWRNHGKHADTAVRP